MLALVSRAWAWLYRSRGLIYTDAASVRSSQRFLVRAFYLVALAHAIVELGPTEGSNWATPGWLDQRALTWPLAWAQAIPSELLTTTLTLGQVAGAAIGALYGLQYAAARWVTFLAVFMYAALEGSSGVVSHDAVLYVVAAGLLACARPTSRERHGTDDTTGALLGIQVYIGLSYCTSGLVKVLALVQQVFTGPVHALQLGALRAQASTASLAQHRELFATAWLEDLPGALQSGLLLGGYAIELAALPVLLLRPRWVRAYAVALLLLHAGALAFIGPDYTWHALLVGLFWGLSPWPASPAQLGKPHAAQT